MELVPRLLWLLSHLAYLYSCHAEFLTACNVNYLYLKEVKVCVTEVALQPLFIMCEQRITFCAAHLSLIAKISHSITRGSTMLLSL